MVRKTAKKTARKTKTRKTAKKTTRKTVAKKTARKAAGRKTTTRKTAKKATKKVAKKVTKKVAKKAAKKVTKKAVKKVAAKPKKLETGAIRKAHTKSQILTYISEHTELSRKEVGQVFEVLGNVMHRHLRKGAAGEFTVPGLMKCIVKNKPATKARKGINPFTGEETTFKAKPARNIVKVRPLKKLKEMAEK